MNFDNNLNLYNNPQPNEYLRYQLIYKFDPYNSKYGEQDLN